MIKGNKPFKQNHTSVAVMAKHLNIHVEYCVALSVHRGADLCVGVPIERGSPMFIKKSENIIN